MKNTILIIEDNQELAKNIYDSIDANLNDFIDIIKIVDNGISALQTIEDLKPKIVLLDLQLPFLSGLKIIEKIKNKDIEIIIISGEISLINNIKIENCKNIKKIYVNPFEFEHLILDIRYLCEKKEKSNVTEQIERQLDIFNFNKNSIGYKYLVECLMCIYYNPNFLVNMESNLFPEVMRRFQIKNVKNIKWAMQKTVKSMLRFTPTKQIEKFFKNNRMPTLKTFITTMSGKVKAT